MKSQDNVRCHDKHRHLRCINIDPVRCISIEGVIYDV